TIAREIDDLWSVAGQLPQVVEQVGDTPEVVYFSGNRQALLEVAPGSLQVAPAMSNEPQVGQGEDDRAGVSQLAPDRQTFSGELAGGLVIAEVPRQESGRVERHGTPHPAVRIPSRCTLVSRQQPRQPRVSLAVVTPHVPEPPEGPAQPQGPLGVPALL